ncbi:F-box protein At5g39450-like isoform X1 [Salvia splendens]|uniref:F-box protein At5g39450-like isoform X1 n=1 Tax=Salvia splendens TaxID=180675 RepID=UPI001103CA21|nr:F-box protein At5g39450-like isoform X1 [Salvia splendens]
MSPDHCVPGMLLALPDDIFSVITNSLSVRDVCSLGLSCRDLHAVVGSDKVWLSQCDKLGLVPCSTLVEWRKGVCSYMALCRFLVNVRPLIGIWVHQNPELGNVLYVMPGFCSLVGCRIIPQEVGPLGLKDGPILWAPVFEIICNYEGTPAFFLHGREGEVDYVCPGLLRSVDRNCNVLLLEGEPRHQRSGGKLAHSKSFAYEVDKEVASRLSRLDSGVSKSQRVAGQKGTGLTFSSLGFGDRRRLLDFVTSQVRQVVPDTANLLLFPCSRSNEADLHNDIAVLCERRLLLLQMYDCGGGNHDLGSDPELPLNPTEIGTSEVCKRLNCPSGYHASQAEDVDQAHCPKGKTLSGFLKNGLKQILGKSSSTNGNREGQKKNASSGESKHLQLHEFLRSDHTIGLSLRAASMKLSSYRAWPNMHDSRYALYKLPLRAPKASHEYAGLWGGTFGWPPGIPSEDKPGKALFFILISYEESEGQQLMIATKILEGTSYVLHPNGSAMFIVNTSQPSPDTFPWDTDEESNHIDVKQSFVGEGIANGYGFRYPGSKPGSLFAIQNGLLIFIWKESRAVLTLQRLNLADLLRKGERVPSLSPISNFAYLTKTYSNVYSGFSNSSYALSSPRQYM